MTGGSRLALAVLVMVLVLGPLVAVHPALTHVSAAGVSNLSREAGHPRVFGLIGLALASALPPCGMLLSLLRAARSRSEMHVLTAVSQPARLGELPYRRFPAEGTVIFTAGFFYPAVFVSSGAERALAPDQLRAALLHEQSHTRRRDVLWRLLLQAVTRGLNFVPGVADTVETEMLRTECRADEYAVRCGARRRDLFEAIVAAAAPPPGRLSAGLTDANVALRLQRLVHPETPLPGPPTRRLLALAGASALPAGVAHAVTGSFLIASH